MGSIQGTGGGQPIQIPKQVPPTPPVPVPSQNGDVQAKQEAGKGTGKLFEESLAHTNQAKQQQSATFRPLNSLTQIKNKVKVLGEKGTEAVKKAMSADKFIGAAKRMDESGNTEGAIKILDGLLAKEPDNAEAMYTKGFILLKSGQIDEGKQLFNDALRADPDHAKAYGNLGVIHGNKGDHETARVYFEQAVNIAEEGDDAKLKMQAYSGRATALSSLGNMEGSLDDLDKAIDYAEGEDKVDLLKEKAEYGIENKNHKVAAEAYDSLASVEPEQAEVHQKSQADALRREGNQLLKNGDLEAAESTYQEALKSNPNDYKSVSNLGNVAGERDDHETALKQFDQAIDMMETQGDAIGLPYNNRGQAEEYLGQFDSAAKDYSRAAELGNEDALGNLEELHQAQPENMEIQNTLAKTYAILGQADKATEVFDDLKTKDPNLQVTATKKDSAEDIYTLAEASQSPVTIKTGEPATVDSGFGDRLDKELSKIEGLDYEVKTGSDYHFEVIINNGAELSPEAKEELTEALNDSVLESPEAESPKDTRPEISSETSNEEFDSILSESSEVKIATGLSDYFGNEKVEQLTQALKSFPDLDYKMTIDSDYNAVIEINNASDLSPRDRMLLQTILRDEAGF